MHFQKIINFKTHVKFKIRRVNVRQNTQRSYDKNSLERLVALYYEILYKAYDILGRL